MDPNDQERLVAAARVVVEMWHEQHLYDAEEHDAAIAALANLLPPEPGDGRDWSPREDDPF